MAGTEPIAASRLLRAFSIWGGVPTIEPIPGGRTNENFRVTAAGRVYFARLGIDLPHHGITRANELRSLRLAAAAGVAPEVVLAEEGVLVTAFVDGETLIQGRPVGDGVLRQLAEALQRLHAAPAPADLHPFDPAAICRRDFAALPADSIPKHMRRRVELLLDGTPGFRPSALIHADLIPENVIVAGSRVVLVDWEYAGRGDPVVDLASVTLHFGLDDRQATVLANAYGKFGADRIRALLPVLALREALWCEVQQRFAGVRGDLADYTAMCWQRLERLFP